MLNICSMNLEKQIETDIFKAGDKRRWLKQKTAYLIICFEIMTPLKDKIKWLWTIQLKRITKDIIIFSVNFFLHWHTACWQNIDTCIHGDGIDEVAELWTLDHLFDSLCRRPLCWIMWPRNGHQVQKVGWIA